MICALMGGLALVMRLTLRDRPLPFSQGSIVGRSYPGVSGIKQAMPSVWTIPIAQSLRVLFSYVLSWPEPVNDSFALVFQNVDCRSEGRETTFAEQSHFGCGGEGVGGVVGGDDGLHGIGA